LDPINTALNSKAEKNSFKLKIFLHIFERC
jgi:hypothetical protein